MMCDNCANCRGIKTKGEAYIIACYEHGEFPLHQDHMESFDCEDYQLRPVVAEPPKNNILLILKCGREFTMYDKDITCNDDMQRRLLSESENDDFVEYDGMLFRISEIAVLSYIGD